MSAFQWFCAGWCCGVLVLLFVALVVWPVAGELRDARAHRRAERESYEAYWGGRP